MYLTYSRVRPARCADWLNAATILNQLNNTSANPCGLPLPPGQRLPVPRIVVRESYMLSEGGEVTVHTCETHVEGEGQTHVEGEGQTHVEGEGQTHVESEGQSHAIGPL